MNFKMMEDLAKYLASKAPDLIDNIQSYVTDRADVLTRMGEASQDTMAQMALNELREYSRKKEELPEDTRGLPDFSGESLPSISQSLPSVSQPDMGELVKKGVDVGKRAMRTYELGEELAWGRISLDSYVRQIKQLNPPDIAELEKKRGRPFTEVEKDWMTSGYKKEDTLEQQAVKREKRKRPAYEYGKPTLKEEADYYAGTGRYPYKRRGKEGEPILGTEDTDFSNREGVITDLMESLEEENLVWGRGGKSFNPYIDKEYSDSLLSKYRNALEDWYMWTLDDSDQVDRGIEPSKRLMTAFNGFDDEGNAKFKKTSSIEEYDKSFTNFETLRHKELGSFLGIGDSPEQAARRLEMDEDHRSPDEKLRDDLEQRSLSRGKDFLEGGDFLDEGDHRWNRDSLLGIDTIDEQGRLTEKGHEAAMNDKYARNWLTHKEPREGAKEFKAANNAWERVNGWMVKKRGHPFYVMPKNDRDVPLRINSSEQVGKLALMASDVALNYIVDGVIFGKDGAIPILDGETIRTALRNIETRYQESETRLSSKEKALVESKAPNLSRVPLVLKKLLRKPEKVAHDLVQEIWDSELGNEGAIAGADEMKALFGTLGEEYVNAKSSQIENQANRKLAEMLKDWLKDEIPAIGNKIIDRAFARFFDDTGPSHMYPSHNRWVGRM